MKRARHFGQSLLLEARKVVVGSRLQVQDRDAMSRIGEYDSNSAAHTARAEASNSFFFGHADSLGSASQWPQLRRSPLQGISAGSSCRASSNRDWPVSVPPFRRRSRRLLSRVTGSFVPSGHQHRQDRPPRRAGTVPKEYLTATCVKILFWDCPCSSRWPILPVLMPAWHEASCHSAQQSAASTSKGRDGHWPISV